MLLEKVRSKIGGLWGYKGVFYRKSMISILLAASIPGFITGLFIHQIGVKYMEKDLSALHHHQMEERVSNIDDQLNYLELNLSNWAFNPQFGFGLSNLDFVYYFQDTWNITKSLNIMEGSHPLVKDVELYLKRTPPVLFKTEYYQVFNDELIHSYEEILADKRRVYWDYTSEDEAESPLMLIHKVPGESSSPIGALIVKLNREKVINLLRTMTPYNEGITYLMQKDGKAILSDQNNELDLQSQLTDLIIQSDQQNGSLVYEYKGESYTVSYGIVKRIAEEWIYVSASPTSAITSPVVVLSKVILIISGGSILIGLLLSFIVSNRMYSPVVRLIKYIDPERLNNKRDKDEFRYIESIWSNAAKQSLLLQQEVASAQPMLRNSFLMQLLQGHLQSLSEGDLLNRMRSLQWKVDTHSYYFIHIYLIGMDSLDNQMTSNDEGLITFAAYNIADELISGRFSQCHVMNFHDLSVGVFIMEPTGHEIHDTLIKFCKEMTELVNQLLKLQVITTVSRETTEIKKMANIFMELERAASYRQFRNQNQMIVLEASPTDISLDDIQYPFELELEILQALRAGQQHAAEQLLQSFMETGAGDQQRERNAQQNILQLLGSIQHMMMQSGVNPDKLFKGENMYSKLSQIRDPQQMLRWMKRKVVLPYIEERASRANVQQQSTISEVLNFIHQHFHEDISLDQCADQVGMNFYALSKLFKNITGVNFIDYVTDLRINRAKELLRQTSMKINDIATDVGYQQRYFNRIFKKQVGQTPSEYRESAS